MRSARIRTTFVLLIALGAGALVVAGVLLYRYGRPSVPLVTYFAETVGGLHTGASVHFRGIEVGMVDGMSIQRGTGHIEVRFRIFTDAVAELGPGSQPLDQQPRGTRVSGVDQMRIMVATNPITQLSTLKLEPSSATPGLVVGTIPPDRLFLPSTPSVAEQLMTTVTETVNRLPGLVDRIDHLVGTAEHAIGGVDTAEVEKDLHTLLARLADQVARSGADLDRLLGVDGPLTRVLATTDAALKEIDLPQTARAARDAIGDLHQTAAELRLLGADLRGSLPAVRAAIDQARAFLRQLQETPDAIIFGPREPTK